MTLLGAPVALFPAVSSLIGAIDPTIFNHQLLGGGGVASVRSGKAALPIDVLANASSPSSSSSSSSQTSPPSPSEDEKLIDAFLKLHLPAQMRQELGDGPSSLAEALNAEAAVAAANNNANNKPAAAAEAPGNNLDVAAAQAAAAAGAGGNGGVNDVSSLIIRQPDGTVTAASGANNAGTSNNNRLGFNLANWFRRQANGLRQSVQEGQQQAQNFWLGGLRRPQRNNLPSNYFVRTPLAWRMMVPYGLLMNFLSWATPLDIPRLLPLADAATYLGEVANPFMGVMFLGSMFLHLAEAGVAWAMSRSYGLDYETSFAWFLQTLGFGMFSLQYLLFPDARYMQRIGADEAPDLNSYNLIDYLEGF